ncbi:MAG: DNA double-strand break repair nuclease NurA [Candidatus Micrarchaeota archaeon]|nr:DNA double-strand break repair nuclease NurA [Candidatus Micrarchaeota archaeon]
MLLQLKELLNKLRARQEKRNMALIELMNNNIILEGMKEQEFLIPIRNKDLDLVVAGIDSSMLWQEFMTADILVVRGVASIISYSSNKRIETFYYPLGIENKIIFEEGLDIHELSCFKSLNRIKEEIEITQNLINDDKADMLILDGSIIPLPVDKPEEESKLYPLYTEVINKLAKLFNSAKSKDKILCAIAKDSRAKLIIEKAKKKYEMLKGLYSSDIAFLSDLMPENSRTSVFSYEVKQPNKSYVNPILKDLEKHNFNADINVFYMRLSLLDKPIRIETVVDLQKINDLAGILSSLCAINRNYTYPAVLIDADLKAKIDQSEMDRIITLMSLENLTKTRRTNRPFR